MSGAHGPIIPPRTFTTERLFARPQRMEDAQAIFDAYANDPLVTRYLSWRPYDRIEPLKEFLEGRIHDWEAGQGNFAYALIRRSDNALIGSIGAIPEGGKVMFGYVLGRAWWGNGYMSEALTYLVNWALTQPAVYRAWAFCDVENPASARVMEKAGLSFEGVLRRWHLCPCIGTQLRDCRVYAKVR